ncbi:MAG TPA: metal-sensing transcriptional repressor [Firmicutes bacterium]|nr:metal-sensing transcriptional repressor [Bacillota bacterium]
MEDMRHTPACDKCRVWTDEELLKDLTVRLNRIEGQIRGINRMLNEGVYCNDVLVQIASAQSALQSVTKLLLKQHMKSCVLERLKAGEEQVIDELLHTIFKLR